METDSPSRWWYGIAATVVLGVLLYGFLMIFLSSGPDQTISSDGELIVMVFSLIATFVMGVFLYLMTIVFIISFVLDWWYISETEIVDWSPTIWYLVVPFVALINFIVPVVATPVTTLGGAYYLFQRYQAVGVPDLGRVI